MKCNITSMGMGVTNKCNLNCPHCYSRPLPKNDLSPSEFLSIVKSYPDLKHVNFGTGESILNQNFLKIMAICRRRKIEMALTTNGLTVRKMDDEHLAWFQDIDFSLDFPSAKLHDSWRRIPGLFRETMKGIKRCGNLGINTSIACCLMNTNYKYLPKFRRILDKYNIFLRLNIYKPARTDKFSLKYGEFWEAIRLLAKHFRLVSSTEPILSAIVKNNIEGSPCGDCSIRIHPDKSISPCVYLQGKKISLEDFQRMKKEMPDFCKNCDFKQSCRGGCLSRRILNNAADKPDAYCPLHRHKRFPKIKFRKAEHKKFIHSDYLCTIIVR